MIAPHDAVADSFFELLFDRLGGNHLFERHFEDAGRIVDVLGDENMPSQAIADFAGLQDVARNRSGPAHRMPA